MNILYIIPYFTFSRGGDVAVCYNLACEMTRKGHNVTILTTTFEYDAEDTDFIENLEMIPVDYKFNVSLFIYTPDMKKWLKEHIADYDIIHMHELRSYQNNVVMKYAQKYHVPFIIQPHASTPTNIGSTFFKKVFDIVYGKRLMRNADGIIAVSDEEAYYDKLMTDKPVDVIYNGMNFDEFKNLPRRGSFSSEPYILYLGRMDKLKGINYLIEAFAQMPCEFSDYKLVIAGKISDYKEELDSLILKYNLEERVVFTGYVKSEDKISIYHDAKLFVNAVKYMGGVSLTVFEALLSGTPVVVTPESGELVKKINGGTIVEYANVEELRDAMIQSLTDEKLTSAQIRNAQEYIYSNLSWSDVTDKIIEKYQQYIGDNADD